MPMMMRPMEEADASAVTFASALGASPPPAPAEAERNRNVGRCGRHHQVLNSAAVQYIRGAYLDELRRTHAVVAALQRAETDPEQMGAIYRASTQTEEDPPRRLRCFSHRLALCFGVAPKTIRDVLNGRTWRGVRSVAGVVVAQQTYCCSPRRRRTRDDDDAEPQPSLAHAKSYSSSLLRERPSPHCLIATEKKEEEEAEAEERRSLAALASPDPFALPWWQLAEEEDAETAGVAAEYEYE